MLHLVLGTVWITVVQEVELFIELLRLSALPAAATRLAISF